MNSAAVPGRGRGRRWLRRLGIGGAVAVALFALIGFLIVPPIAKHVAQRQLGDLLGRPVRIGKIRINPFALSVSVEDFQIFESDGTTPFVGFSRLYVNAQLSSVFRRAPVLQEISLVSPRARIVRTKATDDAWADVASAYNFSDIVARLAARPKTPEPPEPPDAAPPRFSLNNIRITDGAVTFDDRPLGEHHQVTALSIGVPFVSTLPVYLDSFVEPGLSLLFDGTPFSVGGRTKPFRDSLETVLELRLQSLDLTRYVPFVPMALPFTVDSARLTLALDVGFVRPRDESPRLTVKGRVALEKLDVREKRKTGTVTGAAPLAALDLFELVIGDADLSAMRFHATKVRIAGLDLHVERWRDGTLNLQHLAPAAPRAAHADKRASAPSQEKAEASASAKAQPKGGGGAEPRFTLDLFALEKATVHFRDEAVTPAFASDVRDLSVTVRGLSNAPGVIANVSAGLRAVPGGTITQHGTLRLAPLAATGTIAIEGIEPARLAPYYRDRLAFDIIDGRVRLGASYRFEQERARQTVQVNDAFFELADLVLRRREARDDFFRLGALAVHGAALDLGAHTVEVAEVTTHDARIRAARDAHGVVDLTTLVAPAAVAEAHGATADGEAVAAPATPPASAAEPTWTVTLKRFDLDRWSARFDDRAVQPRALLSVDGLALHATNLSTVPGAKLGFDLRLGVNNTGRIQLTGSAVPLPPAPQPVTANVRFDLRALEIVPLQTYFVAQTRLTVTGGAVSVKGQAALKVPAGKDPQVSGTADLDVADLATVDRDRQEPLLKWRSFHVGGVRIASSPMVVAIHDVGLSDFESRLVLLPEARLNLLDALAKADAPKPAATTPAGKSKPAPPAPPTPAPVATAGAPAPQISVDQVTLQGGQVHFSDRSIKPTYAAEMTELGGKISGLSSVAGSTADVDIHGTINRSGSLTIAGKANPLAKEISLDVQVGIKDFELPPTSPYTGRFAGYDVSKGKLDIALDYKIANRKLDAHNRLVLDQFTFGDKVDSPDAVHLPVRLAVALLKDRHGVIDIELPIAGSLDDPDFKVGGAILKVLGNLVVKAVTAPFSLLASAFGGGDELSRLDFAPGAATLDATASKRIGILAKALQERPGISFEIEGGADTKLDRDGLRAYLLERKLKAKKLTELVQAGAAVASPDQITLDPADRARLLEATYKTETFAKPKDAAGQDKTVTPAEMQALLLTNTRVEDDDLRSLALRRATVVQGTLSKTFAGAAGRLFLITPRVEGKTGGHVELKLKKD